MYCVRKLMVLCSVGLLFGVALSWSSGCSQPAPLQENAKEQNTADGSTHDAGTQDKNVADTGPSDQSSESYAPDEPVAEIPPTTDDEPTSSPDEPASFPEEPAAQDDTPETPLTESPTETDPPELVTDGGPADNPAADGGPAEPTPEKPVDAPANCGKEGQTISLSETCCPGLKKGSTARPPDCVGIGQTFVCVKCGDGKCDASKGETSCSCPNDCPKPGNPCEAAKGTCQNPRLPCKPGSRQDTNLSCNNSAMVCCVPATGCKLDCDCPQGLLCAPGTGRCVAGIVPAYCCDKSGCPTGKACTDTNGTKATCP